MEDKRHNDPRMDTLFLVLRALFLRALLLIGLVCHSAKAADSRELASRLFLRLTGAPLLLDDPRRAEMESLIDRGMFLEAAHIATADSNFYNVTLREWATPLSNRDENRFAAMSDFIAMIIGTVRDGRDFREILTGDYSYIGDPSKLTDIPRGVPATNDHYSYLDSKRIDLRSNLIRVEPQRPAFTDGDGNARAAFADTAGVLTSLGWTVNHLAAGTNRRIVQFTFQEFLCRPLSQIMDTTLPDMYVRRDVDRSPGGSSKTYEGTCRGCHAGLDGLSSAFAFVNERNGDFNFAATVQGKMNQNSGVYSAGKTVSDATWTNLWLAKPDLGFRGPQTGTGVRAFGSLMANSFAFSKCMAGRVFAQTCRRSPISSEDQLITELAERFEANHYDMRSLFENVAVLPVCVGR